MKPNIDIPAVTAHALGEGDPATERLLRMTYGTPEAAEELEQECEAIRDAAGSLRRAFATLPSVGLTDAQREAIFEKTAAPFPANRDTTADPQSPAARRRYERRPAVIASLLTAAAAAAVVALLSVITSTPDSKSNGRAQADGEQEEIARMKIVPQSKVDKMREAQREARNRFADAPPPMVDYSLNPELLRTQATEGGSADSIPQPSEAKPALPKPAENTASSLPAAAPKNTAPRAPGRNGAPYIENLASPKR